METKTNQEVRPEQPAHAGARGGSALTATPARAAGGRLSSIDAMRGLVIVLMVLDHTRDFVGAGGIDATDVAKSYPLLFFTRWVTHYCAPTFVFLAGTSAYLMRARMSSAGLRRFLLVRGLWLVLLELTVVRFAWTFDLTYRDGLILQVIWAIGASMCALAALTYLSDRALLVCAVLMVGAHNLLDPIAPGALGSWAPLWNLVHVQGRTWFGVVFYPLVPWVGVMAVGYVAGALYDLPGPRRRAWLVALGMSSSALFLLLRTINVYGDPRPWTAQASATRSVLSFLNVSKYPPSLLYVLMTLGPMLVLLAWLELRDGLLSRALRTVGQVPLFAYVVHLFIAHTLAGIIGLLTGRGVAFFSLSFDAYPSDWGFGLGGVYASWLFVLALLYPACRWFGVHKRARKVWWLAYL